MDDTQTLHELANLRAERTALYYQLQAAREMIRSLLDGDATARDAAQRWCSRIDVMFSAVAAKTSS